MKPFFLTLFVLFALTLTIPAQRRGKATTTPQPKPLTELKEATQPPPKAVDAKSFGLFVEKYVIDLDVNSDGTGTKTYETMIRFDSQTAIETFGKYQRIFNGDLERIEVLETYVKGKDAKEKAPLPADSVRINPTAQAEAAPGFSSQKLLEIDLGKLKIGDIAYYKYRITVTKPHFNGHFDAFELFPVIFDWASGEINISAPIDYPLYSQAVGLEGGRLADENGRARWKWRKSAAKGFEFEVAMADSISHSSRLAITSFKNYEELGATVWAAARSKTTITPELKELAATITKDITEPKQQASAIYEWVNKNIRYLLIVLERGGWIPHDANQIAKNGYGDCKDYTILIHTLLKEKGIESYPVLIRADVTEWLPDVATPSFFNHEILYIPSLNMFADATAPNTRLGLVPQGIVGKQGFLSSDKVGLIKVPGDEPAANEIVSDVTASFTREGALRATSKNRYNGRGEIVFRPLFTTSGASTQSGAFVKRLLAYYGMDGSGRLSKISNPFKVGEPFEVEMEVDLSPGSAFLGKGTVPVPMGLNLLNLRELEAFAQAEKRLTNLLLGASHFRETYSLKFPEGVTILTIPETISFENSTGKFVCAFKIEGDSVRVTRELIIKKDLVTPAEYPGMKELFGNVIKGFDSEIGYETAGKTITAARPRPQSTRAVPSPKTPSQPKDELESLLYGEPTKKLSPREVTQMEAALVREPGNTEARKALLIHYGSFKLVQKTAATEKARVRHRLWFIQNRPELNDHNLLGTYSAIESEKGEYYTALKTEWIKQVGLHPENAVIRFNAAEFMERAEPGASIDLLLEGEKLHTSDYQFPRRLVLLYYRKAGKKTPVGMLLPGEPPYPAILLEKGERALVLIKKERSIERDRHREDLLEKLSQVAFELKKYDRARAFAMELILDFGSDASSMSFEQATHTGNIVLGKISLAENDLAKAKEYLLVAIRAPLRSNYPWIRDMNMSLARELLAKGEKETVLEYLRLCQTSQEKINGEEKYHDDEIKTLKAWQEQIKAGKTPSFDFDNP